MKLRHVGIVVDDLKAAIEWYKTLDYYPFAYESVVIDGRQVLLCKSYHTDGSCIEILDGSTAKGHISLTVNRLLFDKLRKDLDTKLFKKAGVCYIRDPWGNFIEIVEE